MGLQEGVIKTELDIVCQPNNRPVIIEQGWANRYYLRNLD